MPPMEKDVFVVVVSVEALMLMENVWHARHCCYMFDMCYLMPSLWEPQQLGTIVILTFRTKKLSLERSVTT